MPLHHNEDSVPNVIQISPPYCWKYFELSGEFELLGLCMEQTGFLPYKYIVFIAFYAHTPCFAVIHLET